MGVPVAFLLGMAVAFAVVWALAVRLAGTPGGAASRMLAAVRRLLRPDGPGEGQVQGPTWPMLAASLEGMGIGAAIFGPAGQLLACNGLFCERLGMAADRSPDALGAGGLDALLEPAPPEAAGRREPGARMRLDLRCGERVVEARRHVLADGVTVITCADVTDARARQARHLDLLRRTSSLAAAVESTSNGVVVTDPNLPGNPIVFVNPAFTRMTGYAESEVIGRNCRLLQGRDTDPETVARLRKAVAARRALTVTIRNYRKDGRTFWNELTINPVFDERGQVVNFVGIQSDVTARVRAEDALRRRERELRELADTLRHAKEQAEFASRSKSDFLANVSHELRTPLNAIIGFSEIMMGEMFGPIGRPQYREYARDIHTSGVHLLSIINDILDLSKIEAGKLELHLGEVALPEVVEGCLRLVRDRAAAGSLALEAEIAPDLPPLSADERAVKQMLLNLLSNAIKFTPAGGRVRVRAALTGAGDFAIAVSDTGIGIAEADIERAMAAFSQVENPMTRKVGGTGLGLPLVRLLAELHGGSLALASRPNAGTTVTITLPRARASLAA